MAFDLDGFAVLRSMAVHPDLFVGIEAEAAKIARTLLTRMLKDRATTLPMARAMAAALPEGTLAHVTDAMTDAEIASLATRFDRLSSATKADRHAKAVLIGQLLAGATEPATKPTRGAKVAAPERIPRKKVTSGVEAATKVLQSKAMGARKTARAAGR